jgi:pilus assembly protein CpaB
MRAKTILVGLFVISILVAAIAFIQMMAPKGGATVPKTQILAATMPLPAGTLLRAQDVAWHPGDAEPDQIVRPENTELKPEADEDAKGSVYGAVLRRPLAEGEPIRRGSFVKPGDRDFLQVVLTPGGRAIAIPVSTGGASTGLLSPGDRVDVILTQNFKNDNAQDLKNTPITRRSVAETVVESLRVLAIDTPDPKATPANGNFGRTVTLEVTADQAELINVAAELGKLSVTLRSITGPSTTLVSTSPEPIKAKWAGDASPALYGAAQEKPIALVAPPVQVFHGAGKDGEKFNSSSTQSNVRPETVKPEN